MCVKEMVNSSKLSRVLISYNVAFYIMLITITFSEMFISASYAGVDSHYALLVNFLK